MLVPCVSKKHNPKVTITFKVELNKEIRRKNLINLWFVCTIAILLGPKVMLEGVNSKFLLEYKALSGYLELE